MNSRALYSAVHLFVVLLIVLLGALFVTLAFSEGARFWASMWIILQPSQLFNIGIAIGAAGIVLLSLFLFLHRRAFIEIKMKPHRVKIDAAIADEYVEGYWRELFKDQKVESEVIVHSPRKLEIVAHLPGEVEETLLHRIQNELGVLLSRRLGYEYDFLVTLI